VIENWRALAKVIRGRKKVKQARLRLILAVTFTLGVLCGATTSAAQQGNRIPHVGVLLLDADAPDSTRALRDGLREFGWSEGQNLVLGFRFANRREQALAPLAKELVQQKVDVLVAVGAAAALAVQRATRTIPIVMAGIGDPIRLGLVRNLARPDANVTGVSLLLQELGGKRLELLKEVLPRLSRVAVLYHDNESARASLEEMWVAGPRLGLELRPVVFRSVGALPEQLRDIRSARAEAMVVVPSPVLDAEARARIAELALRQMLPTIFGFPDYADAGGLMSYGSNLAAAHRRAAYYIDKLLKGAKPADLPVEQPTKFELVVNLKTAKALGLTLPQSLLLRADRVIQ
jgi:putative ABC transport system substrate-binding protein